jgi:hypothetical protein
VEILKLYNVTSITGDRYSSGWNAGEWARAGIRYVPSQQTKSELYLSALPMFLSGQVRLVDDLKLRQQFVALQRRVHSNGRESIDDSGSASSHDDLSNSCAGAMVLASVAPKKLTFAPPPDWSKGAVGYDSDTGTGAPQSRAGSRARIRRARFLSSHANQIGH